MLEAFMWGTLTVAVYAIAAQAVAVFSTVEIGPNLLAAITAVLGALTLFVQLTIVRRANKQEVKADKAGAKAVRTADRVTDLEQKGNGD